MFAHVRQEAEVKIIATNCRVAFFLLSLGENALVIQNGQVQCLMDKGASRRKHCFAGQRARFEGSNVVAEHVQDVVNEFLGQAEAAVIVRIGDHVEVDGKVDR